ncbi:MAG: SMP-30/gluconolactonase/LRE family protein [Bacteroidia bacterium]|nr:SMP-30/gluconolactonase/LRE family protein [Bacteroidia bacterium]
MKSFSTTLVLAGTLVLALACEQSPPKEEASAYPTTGSIERLDPALDAIIAPGTSIEVLADSFVWSEGPVWIGDETGFVVFSDVPSNEAFRWKDGEGLSSYLNPSGYTGPEREGSTEGSNGLTLDLEGNLVLCQHGDRRVARMLASTSSPEPSYETIVGEYQGKRFNSPNDAVFRTDGMLYFTDPPYGLQFGPNDTLNREIAFNGVYAASASGEVSLIDSTMTRPNGIALSPDESILYVANSDPQAALWKKFTRDADGQYGQGEIFADATDRVSEENKGMPDGMRVLSSGEVIATGPGGVLVYSAEGRLLGVIRTGQRTANCEIGKDGYLYMTAHMFLMRVKLAKT